MGFSIKSEAGASPTLLNASSATTFVYKLKGNDVNDELKEKINNISGNRKIQERVIGLYHAQTSLHFAHTECKTFANNLQMIDDRLPEMIAMMMEDCYRNRNMNIKDAVERISKVNPFSYDLSQGHDFYGYKVKTLLVATALGMVPATRWSGHYDATGGYLVVKRGRRYSLLPYLRP